MPARTRKGWGICNWAVKPARLSSISWSPGTPGYIAGLERDGGLAEWLNPESTPVLECLGPSISVQLRFDRMPQRDLAITNAAAIHPGLKS